MKINYQLKLDKIITQLQLDNKRPNLLLHSCCGPCSSYVLEYLSKYFDITCFFYNPNISPYEEYILRLNEQKRLLNEFKFSSDINFIDGEYNNKAFINAVKGFELEPEGGKRCEVCFRLRMSKTAKLAKDLNFDYFATTLTVSPHKDATLINTIGKELEAKYNINYLISDFKKRNGYKRSIEICRELDIYRQTYCGCLYSK